MDLIIRNARLRGVDATRDIGVDGGKIAKIEPRLSDKATKEIDAEGRLVTPGFIDLHSHLDKCLTGEWVRTAIGADFGSQDVIPAATALKKQFTDEDIRKRAGKSLDTAITHGATAVRVFTDVDTTGGLMAVKSLLKVKEDYKAAVDIQVVAFAQEGLVRDPGSEELLHEALSLGADIVGGIPWYEWTSEDSKQHTDIIFDIAKRHDKDVHMLVDDTEDTAAKNLEYLLVKAIKENYIGRVAASHCRGALAADNNPYAAKIVNLAKRADATVVENSHVSLFGYGRSDRYPVSRGITRVREFLRGDVNVAIGQDDIDDPYYAYGRQDMLELVHYMIHGAHLTSPKEMEAAYDMITVNGAKAMRLPNYGMEVGCNADLVILDAAGVHEAIRMQAERRYVLKRGRVVAENKISRELHIR